MFERFTDRARRLVVHAQEESRQRNHRHIGAEHLLLGLLDDEQAVGTRVLAELAVDLAALRQRVEQAIGTGPVSPPASGHIPFTPQAKKTLEMALREALKLRHNYIGTEHIMLALLRLEDGVAANALAVAGIDPALARQHVQRVLAEERATRAVPADHEEIPVGGGAEDPAVADARAAKDAALDRGDFEAAALFRDVELRLLHRRRAEPAEGAEARGEPGSGPAGERGGRAAGPHGAPDGTDEPGAPDRLDPPG